MRPSRVSRNGRRRSTAAKPSSPVLNASSIATLGLKALCLSIFLGLICTALAYLNDPATCRNYSRVFIFFSEVGLVTSLFAMSFVYLFLAQAGPCPCPPPSELTQEPFPFRSYRDRDRDRHSTVAATARGHISDTDDTAAAASSADESGGSASTNYYCFRCGGKSRSSRGRRSTDTDGDGGRTDDDGEFGSFIHSLNDVHNERQTAATVSEVDYDSDEHFYEDVGQRCIEDVGIVQQHQATSTTDDYDSILGGPRSLPALEYVNLEDGYQEVHCNEPPPPVTSGSGTRYVKYICGLFAVAFIGHALVRCYYTVRDRSVSLRPPTTPTSPTSPPAGQAMCYPFRHKNPPR